MMALVFLRIVVELLAGVIGVAGALILCGIGRGAEAVTHLAICGAVAWAACPNAEQHKEFAHFQKMRTPWKPKP